MLNNLFLYLVARRRIGKVTGVGTDEGRGTLAGTVVSADLLGIVLRDYDGDILCFPWRDVTKLIYGPKYQKGYLRFSADQRAHAEAEDAMRAEPAEPQPALTPEEIRQYLLEQAREQANEPLQR